MSASRRVLRAAAAALYRAGALGAAAILWMAATGGGEVATAAPGEAPVLLLDAGEYELLPTGVARMYPLTDRGAEIQSSVAQRSLYVLDVPPSAAQSVELHRLGAVRASLSLLAALVFAPIVTLPGTLALEATRGTGAPPDIASVRRRVASGAIDLVAMFVLALILLLFAPVFRAFAGFFLLAPVAYTWTASARGRSIGQWLTLLRVVDERGDAPGAWRGLLRMVAMCLGWALAGAGLLSATLDGSRRTFHDRLSATRVVRD